MAEYLCYKIKIKNPSILLKTMLTEGAIRAEIFDALERYHMNCDDILINEYGCGEEMSTLDMGEEMTPAEYRARVRSIPVKRQIPRKR